MRRRYPFLRFQSGVNWKGVTPALLARLNNLGAALGKVITITSGHRTREEQAYLYERYKRSGFNRKYIAAKPGRSNHEHGNAVDATIEGKAIASVVSDRTLKRYGLKAPVAGDDVHVELGGKPAKGSKIRVDAEQGLEAPAGVPLDMPQATPPGAPPSPESTQTPIMAPGTVPAAGITPKDAWRLIATLPDADPEARVWAERAELAGGQDGS